MGQTGQGKTLGCWLGIHAWVTRVDADARWQECRRCAKYKHGVVLNNRFPPAGLGDGSGGASEGPPDLAVTPRCARISRDW